MVIEMRNINTVLNPAEQASKETLSAMFLAIEDVYKRQVLGRPKGRKNKKHKLVGKNEIITEMLGEGISKSTIAKKLGVSRNTCLLYTSRCV